jgi:hypothetical protein
MPKMRMPVELYDVRAKRQAAEEEERYHQEERRRKRQQEEQHREMAKQVSLSERLQVQPVPR